MIGNDINRVKKYFESLCAKKCIGTNDISQYPHGEECVCKKTAEIQAYLYKVLGKEYYRYTIWDFDGRSNNKDQDIILDTDHILEAKKKIISYCWRDVSLDDIACSDKNSLNLDEKSIIDIRKRNGTNVVIYASADGTPKGRTIAASIIMKEAIRRRTLPGRSIDSYEWIKFPKLMHIIQDRDNYEDGTIKYCDWLVVDDITSQSGGTRASARYVASQIDPFFIERQDSGLPTIFVFRFDIDGEGVMWEEQFGVAIAEIVSDPNTCKIKLS